MSKKQCTYWSIIQLIKTNVKCLMPKLHYNITRQFFSDNIQYNTSLLSLIVKTDL